MTDDLIGSDHPLSDEARDKLPAVLDTLLPASDDGRMPSAASLDFVAHLNANEPEFFAPLEALLGLIDPDFSDGDIDTRVAALKEIATRDPESFNNLLINVYACYYQDDRALSGIGMEQGPPFPRGNTVEDGDLSLLDPVVKKPRGYRKA